MRKVIEGTKRCPPPKISLCRQVGCSKPERGDSEKQNVLAFLNQCEYEDLSNLLCLKLQQEKEKKRKGEKRQSFYSRADPVFFSQRSFTCRLYPQESPGAQRQTGLLWLFLRENATSAVIESKNQSAPH